MIRSDGSESISQHDRLFVKFSDAGSRRKTPLFLILIGIVGLGIVLTTFSLSAD